LTPKTYPDTAVDAVAEVIAKHVEFVDTDRYALAEDAIEAWLRAKLTERTCCQPIPTVEIERVLVEAGCPVGWTAAVAGLVDVFGYSIIQAVRWVEEAQRLNADYRP